jgi:hypothetical protein
LVQFGQVENFSLIYTPADLPFYFLCTFWFGDRLRN